MKKIVTISLCMLFSVSSGFTQDHEKAYTPVVSQAGYSDISLPLIDIGPIPPKGASGHHQHKSVMPERPSQDKTFKNRESALPNGDDPAMQKGKTQTDVTIPVRVFDGIENPDNGSSYFTDWVYPSDANGDIGPNHYVQMCNTIFEIFDREGNSLFGPADNATIWDGFVGDWTGTNDGDPIVLYDERADRWLVSQFAVETEITGGTYWILVAVSSTSNPLGSYYRYAFEFESFPDYPKFGIWEDGYYLSVQHGNGTATAAVLNRDQMLSGTVYPQYIYFNVPNLPGLGFVGMLPADCDGQWPPAGLPNYFIYFSDDAWGDDPVDCLKLWKLQVNWNEPVASTFVLAQTINTAAFDSDFGGFGTEVIPQPGTDQGLDAMSLAMMNRLQFRTFGYYYSMVCCHTVDVDNNDRAGIRWYELRKTNGDWYIYQQSTFAPNSSENFWMGSIAQNGYGDMALGYSVSGSSTFPSLRCTGRNYADPTNQMTYGDMELQQGQSSQIGIDRWGDYCSMNIDPVDHNTFWFTSQYIQNNSNPSTWGTSIAAIGLREYCTAQGGCDEYISNVVRGIQNNISGCTGYADYTNLSTNLVLNMTLDITVHNGNPYAPDQCGIWVDWNRDGDFIDADENIAVSGNPGLGPYDATLQPPDGTSTGPCIMRTRIIYTGTLDPCGSTTYGEVEDYTINVTAAAPNTWIGAISQNWSNPANWSLGHVPYATEDVLITTTGYHPVILDLPLVPCNNLMVQNDASILFFNNGISVQNNAIINGNIYFNGTLCTLHVYKDISWESGSSATINGHGTFFVYGNWTFKPGANVDLSGCTTSFAGFTYQSNIYNLSENCAFGDLVSEKIAPQGLVIAQSSNDILVNGELQSWSQIPLTMESSNQLIVKGDIIIYWASGLNLNSGSLVLQGNNQLLKMNDGQVFNDLTIESQGTVSFADNGFNSFTVNGYLSINSGVFDITGKTVNIFQGWLNSAGPDALIEENSTVIFKGSGYTYCSSEEFDNIEMNSAPGVVVQILDNDFVSCNSYNYTSGGGIETSGTGAGFTAYDLADPGIYGIFRAANGSVINLYQDDASYVDLNGSLFIEGGEIFIHGGLGDCWWPYQGNGSLFMTDGILDFTEAGIYLYDSPSYTLSTAIYGGTIRTTGNFLGYRDDFNPTGGTMGLYGNADVQCVLNDGSNFFDLKIDKATEKGQDISQQKTHMEYRDGSKKPINRNNQVTMSGDIWIAGDFILNSGVVTAPDKISISGDWTNVPGPDAFIEGNGQVVFTGNTDHQYCSTEEFYTLEIDKTAGDLFVASDADIRCMTLVFTQGQVEMHGGMFTAWDLFQNGVYGSYYLDGGTINLYQISGLTGLNGDLVVVNGYFNVFGTEIISSWPDYQDASIFMTGGVINFNTGGIFI
nr:hypothetical protein [Bacteroidota bacterium]